MKKLILIYLVMTTISSFAAAPEIIPALKEWKDGASGKAFKLTKSTCVVEPVKKPVKDSLVTIYAKEFAKELGVNYKNGKTSKGDISIVVNGKSNGSERYTIECDGDSIKIVGESPVAAYWGTRTVLQALNRKGEFPAGKATDWPDFPVRGFMFDCGRKPFALSTLKTLVDICSYYKLNDLQLHLSDNYIWLHNYPGVKTAQDILKYEPSAGGFRLESKIKGLTSTDIAYSKDDFKKLCRYAIAHGVKIVPELDVPGHALQMVRVRPDLMYKGGVGHHKDIERAAMLDLTNPKSFDFTTSIFDEYIDSHTFMGEVVHIGTDEYYGDAESYRAFADKMLKHILAKGKTPRLWGSLSNKRGNTPVVVKGVQMNIWSLGWQNPAEAIKAGYDIINILDRYTYVVPNGKGNIGAYGDDIDSKYLYENWTPRLFHNVDISGLPKEKVLGGAWAVWNDNSFLTDPGLCGRDLLPMIQKNCAAVAAKSWCEAKPTMPYSDFLTLTKADSIKLNTGAPKAWSKTFTAKNEGKTKVLAESDELTLYAVSPVDGKVGFKREGAYYSFDYQLEKGKTYELTFETANRTASLKINGEVKGGTPKRQYFANACRYFTLPEL